VAIDWDEPAARPDSRIHEYRRDGNGDLTYTSKASWSAKFAEAAGLDPGHANPGYDGHAWPEGSEWHTDEVTYRLERLHRRDTIGPGSRWEPVWTAMRTLAGLHGSDHVRLVVWFDR
jgi:hypothetical protein